MSRYVCEEQSAKNYKFQADYEKNL